eukprot:s656_g35.t1
MLNLERSLEACFGLEAVDVLVLNAGVMRRSREVTEDGFELTMAANHLGHFLLAGQPEPVPKKRATNIHSSHGVAWRPMNVLEGVANIARRSVRRLTQETWEDRTLVVRISNGSTKTLEAAEPPTMMAGRCVLSFSELAPGETGTVRFSSAGREFFGNATSGCHHAGLMERALEFSIQGQRLLMAESCPFGHTTLKTHRFVVSFEPGKRTMQEFYSEMPAVFMGCRETQHSTHMQGLCVRVHAVATSSPAVADVVILQEELEQVEYELDSAQQLEFAEWCLSHPDFKDLLGSAMFLAESQALLEASKAQAMDVYLPFTAIFVAIWFSLVSSSDRKAFQDLSLSLQRRHLSRWPHAAISDENLDIWRSFISLLALLGELYALFQFTMSIAFPLPLQPPLLCQMHVTGPLVGSLMVRLMCWKHKKLSFEQIQLLATILNGFAIVNRVDVPKHLLAVNFMVRTLIGAFSACPQRLVTMNLLSAPLALAVEWARRVDGAGAMEPSVDLVHAIANEMLCIMLMNVMILHLSAVFQKQEMATQKLQEEIAAKEKIVKETESLLGAARRLLSVTCDCLVQLSPDWNLKDPDRSVKDMLKLGSKGTAALHFSQFISPEDHERFTTFIRTSRDSDAPSSLHLKMQDTKGSSFHVQLFHVEIPNLQTEPCRGARGEPGSEDDSLPKEHLLGLIRQELKEPPEEEAMGPMGHCSSIPEGQPLDCLTSSGTASSAGRSSRHAERKAKDRRKASLGSCRARSPEGWPKLDSVKLVLDLNTAEHGYAIRSIRVDLLESWPDFSLLKFVHLGSMVWDFVEAEVPGSGGRLDPRAHEARTSKRNCWMSQSPCDEPCLGCKLQLAKLGTVLVREMRVLRIDQEHHSVDDADASAADRKLGYTLLMTVELRNFLSIAAPAAPAGAAAKHKKMSHNDKAFNLTLLIDAFVTSGLVKTSLEALGVNLSSYRSARERCDQRSPANPQVKRHWDEASEVSSVDAEDAEVKAYIEESHMLLRTTAVRCMLMLSRAVAECKVHGQWPTQEGHQADPTLDYPERPHTSPRPAVGGGRHSIAEFFRRSSSLEPDLPVLPHKTPRRSCCSAGQVSEGLEREQLLYLVRNCIHLSADFTRRRSKLLGMLDASQPVEGLQRYRRQLGLTHRNITEHRGGQDVVYNFFSPEVFEELGDCGVSPEEVLQSLGHCAPEYRTSPRFPGGMPCFDLDERTMSTNSKSGELFLFSSDRRFIIKTLSSKELILLMRMMPAYLDHIQRYPRSLIVRYAGLYLIQRGEQFLHFVVMKSVFDPQIPLHLKFDLKGSLYKRRKKAQESVGKDEDWVHSGHRLNLPLEVQREFCAQHELDAQLLESFKMMDYSVLVGVHFVEQDPFNDFLEPGWGDGYLDCKEVYLVGIIDHSIKYGIKKQAENLLRVAQGTSDRASCVSADTYAERQLHFLYDKVMRNPSAMDIGTEGRLRVDIFGAEELIAADWNGASDPYVTVKLGLCVKHTATVPVNCNPTWNCSLYLPVHQAHRDQELKISVWDEDHLKSLRGNDDFLGRLSVPMTWILQGPVDLRNSELSDVSKGRLSLRCLFESADDIVDDSLLMKASPKQPSRHVACCVRKSRKPGSLMLVLAQDCS